MSLALGFVVLASFFLGAGVWAQEVQHDESAVFFDNGTTQGTEAGAGSLKINEILNSMQTQVEDCTAGYKFTQSINGKGPTTRTVGSMPEGYFKGMMMSFSQNLCSESYDPNTIGLEGVLKGPVRRGEDTLQWYGEGSFSNVELGNEFDARVIQNYSLLLPLGMIESSGQFWDGVDQSKASKPGGESLSNANQAEAGLFQVSHNSKVLGKGLMGDVYQDLKKKYKLGDFAQNSGEAARGCLKDVFSKGIKLKDVQVVPGSVEQEEFQKIMRECPAFAVDYMAALSRVTYRHNGPLKRKYARPKESCVHVMNRIAKNKTAVCNSLPEMDAQLNDLSFDFPAGRIDSADPINYDWDTEQYAQEAKQAGVVRDDIQQDLEQGQIEQQAQALSNDAQEAGAAVSNVEASDESGQGDIGAVAGKTGDVTPLKDTAAEYRAEKAAQEGGAAAEAATPENQSESRSESPQGGGGGVSPESEASSGTEELRQQSETVSEESEASSLGEADAVAEQGTTREPEKEEIADSEVAAEPTLQGTTEALADEERDSPRDEAESGSVKGNENTDSNSTSIELPSGENREPSVDSLFPTEEVASDDSSSAQEGLKEVEPK